MTWKKTLLIMISIALMALGSIASYSRLFADKKTFMSKGKVEVIKITAMKFKYTPSHIKIKKGQTTIIELTSLDRLHGFYIPDLEISADVAPGKPVQVSVTPEEAGTYHFLCNSFCGSGHEDMYGEIVVTE
jgi:cytochrome c oxidase subunit II